MNLLFGFLVRFAEEGILVYRDPIAWAYKSAFGTLSNIYDGFFLWTK